MHDGAWLWLLPAAPLAGSVIAGLLHFAGLSSKRRDLSGNAAAGIAILAMAVAFGLALFGWREVREHTVSSPAWSWIDTGRFPIEVALVLDRLSSVMTLVITGVGLLIHIYAAGYMKGDPGYAKFFAYLNLFVFAMLMLVLSSNLVGLFVGWEGVGLCSYLLIGFWYEKGWLGEAGQKAFVMNRIGDACFLLGTFLLARTLGTLDIATIDASVASARAILRSRRCCSSSARPASRRRSRCMSGCPTPWKARRRSPRSSTRRRW
jgi:NADH-quinone oxidoreductase subunit L